MTEISERLDRAETDLARAVSFLAVGAVLLFAGFGFTQRLAGRRDGRPSAAKARK
jgi:uncharacterized membrane protein